MIARHHEIIICGGSLAGLSAAIRLKQLGYDPLVLEKAKFPRSKLCGEFLGPDAFPILQKLGIWDEVFRSSYASVQQAIFYNQTGKPLNVSLSWISRKYPFALAIPRETLDFLLLQYAKRLSIQVLEQAYVCPNIQYEAGQFQLEVQHSTKHNHYTTPILLDASGRSSGLKVKEEQQNQHQQVNSKFRTVGFQCHIACDNLDDVSLRMYLFPGGYGGIQPIAPSVANLCLLLMNKKKFSSAGKVDFHTVMDQTFLLNPASKAIVQNASAISGFNTTANLNFYAGDQPFIQVGDAYVTLDPFTGSGMAHALETGYLAAETIHAALQKQQSYPQMLHCYQRQYFRQYRNRQKLLHLFRPLLTSEMAQKVSWPVLQKFSPVLAAIFR